MKFSQLANEIQSSPTLALNAEAQRLRALGEPILNLGVGEPKNPAPSAAIEAAVQRVTVGDVKYVATSGLPSLKEAVVDYTAANYGRTPDPTNVLISNGAKQSLYNVMLTILNPGDEVILLAPCWVSYPEMVKLARGKAVILQPVDDRFHHDLGAIEAAITDRTRAVLVNSPSNPTGAVYPADFIKGMVEMCESRGIFLIMDDIYHKLVFGDATAPSAYSFTDHDLEDTYVITINGVSKLYGMTGFRIGWVVANKPMVKAMNNIQAQSTSCAGVVSQAAAEGALRGDQSVVEDLRQTIQDNRDMVLADLATIPGVKAAVPDGTFYCLPDFSAINKDSAELANFLLEKARVVTVPGVSFEAEGHLRISFSGAADDIREGVRRIRWALDPASPAEIQMGEHTAVRDWA